MCLLALACGQEKSSAKSHRSERAPEPQQGGLVTPISASEDTSYTFESGERPSNITGLVRWFYGSTGSYYNGTITFTLALQDPNQNNEAEDFHSDGNLGCQRFMNSTLEISYNSLVAITMPGAVDSGNPMGVQIWAWMDGSSLGNYSSSSEERYQYFNFFTKGGGGEDGPNWTLDTKPSSAPGYALSGDISKKNLMWPPKLTLNLTQPCSGPSSSSLDERDYLYEGEMRLATGLNNESTRVEDDWAVSIPSPHITGQFDNQSAEGDISGLFSMYPDSLRSLSSEIVGSIRIHFSGKIDQMRSDQLLLGREQPEWNATLGFEIQSVIENKAGRAHPAYTHSCCALWAGILIFSYLLF
ncbi:hypothetical protein DL95DRAFT_502451 [Leptodontidium sp. 2 PMI_412]|nr:hypothetical protein DL95DRAFT_502451 [Leptodontidium sp. 2 PMI_412]